jgi:hypothetical protein
MLDCYVIPDVCLALEVSPERPMVCCCCLYGGLTSCGCGLLRHVLACRYGAEQLQGMMRHHIALTKSGHCAARPNIAA